MYQLLTLTTFSTSALCLKVFVLLSNHKHLNKNLVVLLFGYTVERMVETGKEILQKNNITDLSDVRWVTQVLQRKETNK